MNYPQVNQQVGATPVRQIAEQVALTSALIEQITTAVNVNRDATASIRHPLPPAPGDANGKCPESLICPFAGVLRDNNGKLSHILSLLQTTNEEIQL